MATIMSADDEAKVKSISSQWTQRKAAGASQGELNDIHHSAEVIKANYGFSGGDDGTGYAPLENQSTVADGTASPAPQNGYLNQLYAAKQQQALSALKSAYDQNTSTLNATAAKIPGTYTAAKNTTAGNAAVNQANFNERAAASGLNSGAGSQAALSMGNALTSNLSALDKEQADRLSDIETQRANLSTQYQNAIATAEANSNIALAQSLYEESVRADDKLTATAQANQALALQQQQYQDEMAQYQDEMALNKAKVLASGGDYSGYKTLYGLSDAQVASLAAYWKLSNTKKTSGGGGGGGGGGGVVDDGGVDDTPVVEFNETTVDENSPAGVIADIATLQGQGYSSAQIKANAKVMHDLGTITDSQYQMYMQYAGMDKTAGTTGGGTR